MTRYGIKNGFKPFRTLTPRPYAWRGTPRYSYNQGMQGSASHQGQLAHEYESGVAGDLANPAFSSGAAGRLNSAITGDGKQPKILRGFIRRANTDITDAVSQARLNFMYNPEEITRQYLSYVGNSPPSTRSTRCISRATSWPRPLCSTSTSTCSSTARTRRIRWLTIPACSWTTSSSTWWFATSCPRPAAGSSQVPDNGVMMVNPQQITVVFSPQLTVQGIPTTPP